MQVAIVTLLLLISGSLYLVLAGIAWHRRTNQSTIFFALLMLALAIYSLGYFMEIHSDGIQGIFLWLRFEYFGISTIPAFWLLFTISFSGRDKWITGPTLAAVFVIPIITILIINTNPYHHLFYRSITASVIQGLNIANLTIGIWYWIHNLYANLSILVGNILLLGMWIKAPRPFRRQSAAIFLSSLVPWIGLTVYLSGNSPFNLDLSPFGLIVTALLVAWSFEYFQLFGIAPIARSEIFEKMLDGTIVLDAQNRIIDVNPAAGKFLNIHKNLVGQEACRVLSSWPELAAELENKPEGTLEFRQNIAEGGRRWIEIYFSPLFDKRRKLLGRLLVIRDNTRRKEAEARLEAANRELAKGLAELDRHYCEIRRLNEISALLQSCNSTDEAYQLIADQLQLLFPRFGGGLYIYDKQNILNLEKQWNKYPNNAEDFSISDWEALRRRVHSMGKTGMDGMQVRNSPEYSSFCIPLQHQEDTLGVLRFLAPAEELDEDRIQLGQAVADTIVLALANLNMKDILLQQTIRDPLTQLFNRRYLEETLERELGRAERLNRPLAIIMADIDHFKQFNDQYGHAVGDKVLQEVSRILETGIRTSDIACRYGGEEFILILPDAALDIALNRAQTLRMNVKAKAVEIEEDNKQVNITVSLGVAVYPYHGSTVESLLRAADIAMYHAKQTGRDRVTAFDQTAKDIHSPNA